MAQINMLASMQPMLADPGHQPFDDPAWIFEPKLDGVRTLVYLGMNSTRLVSRTGRDQTATYPELWRLHERVTAENAVLDGEVVASDPQGRPSFGLLQQRMNLASPAEIDRIRKTIPAALFVFDVLWLDGEDLTGLPWSERRARLEEISVAGKGLNLVPVVAEHGHALFDNAKERGLEGVIAKRAASRYQAGKRSPDWRKIKILTHQDCVIMGWTPGRGGRETSFGALLLGYYQGRALRFAGWKIQASCFFVLSEPEMLGEAMMKHYPMAGMTPEKYPKQRELAKLKATLDSDPTNLEVANRYWVELASFGGQDVRSGGFVIEAFRGCA
jgi:bifunctional non-homologous end joining protein LigD